MKLLSTQEIREWDAFTIVREPISSVDLMERAGRACATHLLTRFSREYAFVIFCGQGNNGGDGLVVARLMAGYGYRVRVVLVQHSTRSSADFRTNLERFRQVPGADIHELTAGADLVGVWSGLSEIPGVIVDALLGSGTNKPLEGLLAETVQAINRSGRPVVSIDVPTGLPADMEQWDPGRPQLAVNAETTLTFQIPKISFLFPETGNHCGLVKILDIGLHPGYLEKRNTELEYLDQDFVNSLIVPRKKFDHKGRFGHALLIAGSRGKNGAAILAARACLRAGAGLLSVGVPQESYPILQAAVPEAMVVPDNSDRYPVFSFVPEKYTAVGLGPGIGTEAKTLEGYKRFLEGLRKPVVIDADGINLLAALWRSEPGFRISGQAVLTPHVKEFERLAGSAAHGYERFGMLREFARKHHVYVLLKGAHSCLATPEGPCYFNSTGNPALAKGGSGDVLTGMITGLLAQGYSPRDAALLGMYYHGKAGDAARRKRSETSVIASDLVEEIRIARC